MSTGGNGAAAVRWKRALAVASAFTALVVVGVYLSLPAKGQPPEPPLTVESCIDRGRGEHSLDESHNETGIHAKVLRDAVSRTDACSDMPSRCYYLIETGDHGLFVRIDQRLDDQHCIHRTGENLYRYDNGGTFVQRMPTL